MNVTIETSVITTVASALISGFKPSRTLEKIKSGKVVEPGPETKEVVTRSSRLIEKASSQPASKAGAISGNVTRKKTWIGRAPRSIAASSIERSVSVSRLRMITATKAVVEGM